MLQMPGTIEGGPMGNATAVHQVKDFTLKSTTKHPNPFHVKLTASFEHESGDKIVNIPGFYNGNDEWLIRFRPTKKGKWTGTTLSEDNCLSGETLELNAAPRAEASLVPGQLKIDPQNPQKFVTDDNKPFVILGFECNWFFAYHQRFPEKCGQKIQMLREYGFNYVVTNLYVQSFLGVEDCPPENMFNDPNMYCFGGTNDDPDHTRMNIDFFKDFDQMVAKLHNNGMMLHLLFQAQNKNVKWPTRYSKEDDLFWSYVAARYQAYSNLIWDLSKESFYLTAQLGTDDYIKHRMNFIKQHDAYNHLVVAHDPVDHSEGRFYEIDGLCDFVCDQVHLQDCRNYNRDALVKLGNVNKPYFNIESGYEYGVEKIEPYIDKKHTKDGRTILKWIYSIFAAGAYANYYYCNTSWNVIKFDPEPESWKAYRVLKGLLDSIPFNQMVSHNDLVDTGFCLAREKDCYFIFLPEGGDFNLDLSFLPHTYTEKRFWKPEVPPVAAEWIDIFTGERSVTSTEAFGFYSYFENPFSTQAAAVIVRIKDEHKKQQ